MKKHQGWTLFIVCIAAALFALNAAVVASRTEQKLEAVRVHLTGRMEGNRQGVLLLSQHVKGLADALAAVSRGDTIQFISGQDTTLVYGLIAEE